MMTIPSGAQVLSGDYQLTDTLFSGHVKFSPNSMYVLASTQDSTIRLWNFQSSKCVKTYTGHTNRTYCLPCCFSNPKRKYVVSGSEDQKIYIWDLQTREVVQILEGHRGNIVPFVLPQSTAEQVVRHRVGS